ncbi:hypothetical protein PR048_004488 [Dryococelus australis]|uniref:HAT C-terminal dimerisation domain-containing protein n=1 Tax=Dryococelus australis TaxID=614101 RepID=A0ABQ9I5L1_9NEOP|nr:hypothetical protein PR048_004488 [Dryococelus australis]
MIPPKEIGHSTAELILLAQEFPEACQAYSRPMVEVAGKDRENPPNSGIVWHDCHLQKFGTNRPGVEPGSPRLEASMQRLGHTAFYGSMNVACIGRSCQTKLATGRLTHAEDIRDVFIRCVLKYDSDEGELTVRILASHQGEQGSISGRVTPGFSQVEIMLDDVPVWRVFSGISRFPSLRISAQLHSRLISPSSDLKTSLLKTSRIPQLNSRGRRWARWLSLPPRRTGFNPRPGHRIFTSENCTRRCRWSAGFLGDLPFLPPLHSGAAPYSLQSLSSALKNSLLRDAQISSLTHSLTLRPGGTSRVYNPIEFSMEQRRNERAGENGRARENPPTSGVVRHDSHLRKSGTDPAGSRTRLVWLGGEQANHNTTAAQNGADDIISDNMWLNYSPPTLANRVRFPAGSLQYFVGRCRWLAGILRDPPFPRPFSLSYTLVGSQDVFTRLPSTLRLSPISLECCSRLDTGPSATSCTCTGYNFKRCNFHYILHVNVRACSRSTQLSAKEHGTGVSDTGTHIKCRIATMGEALNKRARFFYVEGLGNSGSNMCSVLKATFRHRLKFVFFSNKNTETKWCGGSFDVDVPILSGCVRLWGLAGLQCWLARRLPAADWQTAFHIVAGMCCWSPQNKRLFPPPRHKLARHRVAHRLFTQRRYRTALCRLITENSLECCFPNVDTALRIYLSLMVSNCTGERSFLKLKRIENEVSTTMSQNRLNNLTLMSIEHELLGQINVSVIINKFSHAKARRVFLQFTRDFYIHNSSDLVLRIYYYYAFSSSTKANRVRFPAGSLPDFRMRESCRAMPLAGGFSRGSPASPPLHTGAAPYSPSLHPHRLSRPRSASQISPLHFVRNFGVRRQACTHTTHTHACKVWCSERMQVRACVLYRRAPSRAHVRALRVRRAPSVVLSALGTYPSALRLLKFKLGDIVRSWHKTLWSSAGMQGRGKREIPEKNASGQVGEGQFLGHKIRHHLQQIGSQDLNVRRRPNLSTHLQQNSFTVQPYKKPPEIFSLLFADTYVIHMLLLSRFNGAVVVLGVSNVGIVPDDATGRRVFSGIFPFLHSFIPVHLHTHLASP